MTLVLVMFGCRHIQSFSRNFCHFYHFQMDSFKISFFCKSNLNSLISVYKQSHSLFIHINQLCFLHIFSLAKMPYIQRQNIPMIVIHMIQNSFYAYIHFFHSFYFDLINYPQILTLQPLLQFLQSDQ